MRSEETAPPEKESIDFFVRVHELVARIPFGSVTTYGHLAEHLGARRSARAVGWALNAAAGTPLPCHRVVNRFGGLSGKRHFEGPHVMEERLRSEGVTFTPDGCVDLERHLWVPDGESPSE
jgi:methylated-DNA-protein-cysteine methyltransferase related protein